MKIAITGSTGFIGSAIISNLSKNKTIDLYPFDKNRYSLSSIASLKAFVENKDIIIHLAGVTEATSPEDCYNINTFGTFNLLEAISLYGKPHTKFIFSSSFAVYEEISKKGKLSEDNARTIPRNHYGMSKKFAEELITFYNRKGKLSTRILRISNPYGPGKKKVYNGIISILIDKIQNRKTITINGDGSQSRDFIFIDDIVQAIINTISYKGNSLVINVCCGKEMQIIKLVKKIEILLGKKAILKFNKNYSEKGCWIGDSNKALKEINFSANTNIDDGLRKTINCYQQKKAL